MKISWSQAVLATLLASGVLLCGCGGVSASPSFSPMMLLLPGVGKNDRPTHNPVEPGPTGGSNAQPDHAG
ncbi:MAG: hypothetical protein IPM17_15005 [Verrucomicrobia bacterium]|nr:hypothetical protein [Verrucomicrobiota bacterium]